MNRYKVQVGPSVITIHQGNTFMVTTPSSEINPGELGLFADDTRLVSGYKLSINGQPWALATSASVSYFGAHYVFLSPEIRTADGCLEPRKIELRLERTVDEGFHEDFDLTNYSDREVSFHLEIAIESDFADIFEVRGHQIGARQIDMVWDAAKGELTFKHERQHFSRAVIYRVKRSASPPHFANGKVYFQITLPPKGKWHACCEIIPVIGGNEREPPEGCYLTTIGDTRTKALQSQWHETVTRLDTPNSVVLQTYDQSVYDIGALRLYQHDVHDTAWMPAAGVPWYVTVFGRDSLVVSFQNMLVNCALANGTLKRLAQYQAKKRDDWRDAQPGKILHEMRFGELVYFNETPHGPYYGTADATMLYLILLSETFRWTGNEAILREHRDTALRCLEWIDSFGDLDGDGFQEYKTFSSKGYHNMGWKDAGRAVVYPDGSVVEQPIATCELQGLVYDAKLRMAEVFERLGDPGISASLRSEARKLKARFNETYWMEDEGFYAYALDPDKRQVKTIASNPGHLLWSGIVDSQEKARRVMDRLLKPDMFSGWGVRTLSKRNPAYDPNAYQLGSIWPHDNAFIAAGSKRYGLWREANCIADGIFNAAAKFQMFRLPELFTGVDRTPERFPVQYVGANIPQAWAAGSVFLLLRSVLGIDANLPENVLYLNPTLPDWLSDITLSNLRVGNHRLKIRFRGVGERSEFEVIEGGRGLEITRKDIGIAMQ